MAKRWALFFGSVGYLLPVWYYSVAFAPITGDVSRSILFHACLTCDHAIALHSALVRGAFLLMGPINAAIYAAVGFLAGKLVLAIGRRRQQLQP